MAEILNLNTNENKVDKKINTENDFRVGLACPENMQVGDVVETPYTLQSTSF